LKDHLLEYYNRFTVYKKRGGNPVGVIRSKANSQNLLLFYTETTHLQPGQIVKLSYIISDNKFNITKAKNYYFTVDEVSEGACRVHGQSKRKSIKLSRSRIFDNHCKEIYI